MRNGYIEFSASFQWLALVIGSSRLPCFISQSHYLTIVRTRIIVQALASAELRYSFHERKGRLLKWVEPLLILQINALFSLWVRLT